MEGAIHYLDLAGVQARSLADFGAPRRSRHHVQRPATELDSCACAPSPLAAGASSELLGGISKLYASRSGLQVRQEAALPSSLVFAAAAAHTHAHTRPPALARVTPDARQSLDGLQHLAAVRYLYLDQNELSETELLRLPGERVPAQPACRAPVCPSPLAARTPTLARAFTCFLFQCRRAAGGLPIRGSRCPGQSGLHACRGGSVGGQPAAAGSTLPQRPQAAALTLNPATAHVLYCSL